MTEEQNCRDKTNESPGTAAVNNVIECINQQITTLREANQLDAIAFMQMRLKEILVNRVKEI